MNKNYLEILEECYLDLMSDASIGKIQIKSSEQFQEESLKWMNSRYEETELKRLMSTFQDDGKIKPLLDSEILKNQISFIEHEFIPKILDLRQSLKNSLSEGDKKNLEKLKSDYLSEYKKVLEEKKRLEFEDSANQNSDKIKEFELLEKLGEIYPSIEMIKRSNEHLYRQLFELGLTIKEIPDNFRTEYQYLCKERYKTRLGNIKNMMMTVRSLQPSEDQEILNIVELLLIS